MKSTIIISAVLILCMTYIYFFYSTRYISYEGKKLTYSAGLQYYDSGKATIHVFGISLRRDKGIPSDTASTQKSFDSTPLTSQIVAYRALQNFIYFFGLTEIIILAVLLFLCIKWIRNKVRVKSVRQNENKD